MKSLLFVFVLFAFNSTGLIACVVNPQLKTCVAIRGNGERAFSSLSALSQMVLNLGPIDAFAGSSSGGPVTWMYESMSLNPAIEKDSNGKVKDTLRNRMRLSVMLKSVQAYIEHAQMDREVRDLFSMKSFLENEMGKINVTRALLKAPSYLVAIYKFMRLIRSNHDIFNMIDPELLAFLKVKNYGDIPKRIDYIIALGDASKLANLPVLERKALARLGRIIDSSKGGFYNGSSNEIFFRPAILNFSHFTKLMARMNNFYAQRFIDPNARIYKQATKDWDGFFQKCSHNSAVVNKAWQDIGRQTYAITGWSSKFRKGKITCAQRFWTLLSRYRKEVKKWENLKLNKSKVGKSRLNDFLGEYIPVIYTSAMIQGESNYEKYQRYLRMYNDYQLDGDADTKEFDISSYFKISKKDIQIAHFGLPSHLKKVEKNQCSYRDSKTKRFFRFKNDRLWSWGRAITLSGSEPGLGRVHPDPIDRVITVGGWLDGHATKSLRNLGCENVFYLHRKGKDSGFATNVAKLLVKDKKEHQILHDQLFSYDNPNSAFNDSMRSADGIWCTDWGSYNPMKGTQMIAKLIQDALVSPFMLNGNSVKDLYELDESKLNLINFSDVATLPNNERKRVFGCVPVEFYGR